MQEKNNNMLMRILWILSGILLIIAGVICVADPTAALVSFAAFLGVVMLASGVIDIIIFAKWHTIMMGAGFELAEGILTILLAIFLICNEWLAAMALPFIFAAWLLFSGVSKAIASFDLKKLGISIWYFLTALGILDVVLGIVLFFQPSVAVVAIGMIIGFTFFVQGIAAIFRGIYANQFLL